MIFTVGRTTIYNLLLRDDPNPTKLGSTADGYSGGSVWETREAAQHYLDVTGIGDEFSVYGVVADWDRDTEPEPGQEWHRLLVTSKLVRLDAIV